MLQSLTEVLYVFAIMFLYLCVMYGTEAAGLSKKEMLNYIASRNTCRSDPCYNCLLVRFFRQSFFGIKNDCNGENVAYIIWWRAGGRHYRLKAIHIFCCQIGIWCSSSSLSKSCSHVIIFRYCGWKTLVLLTDDLFEITIFSFTWFAALQKDFWLRVMIS